MPLSTWPTLPPGRSWSPFHRHPPDSWRRNSGTSNKTGTEFSRVCVDMHDNYCLHVGRMYWRVPNYFTSSDPHHDMSKQPRWHHLHCVCVRWGLILDFMSASSPPPPPRFFSSSASSSPPLLQPSAPHCSLPDITSGYSQLHILIVENILAFFLTFFPTSFLTAFRHSFWHISWHFVWHSFRHSLWDPVWHIFWRSLWHISCNSVWHSVSNICDLLADICLLSFLQSLLTFFLASLLTFFPSYLLTFCLAFFLTSLLTFCLPSFWHSFWHLCWNPVCWLRPGREHWQRRIAFEQGEGGPGRRRRGGGGGDELWWTHIKSI